jgi:hypothetical protein
MSCHLSYKFEVVIAVFWSQVGAFVERKFRWQEELPGFSSVWLPAPPWFTHAEVPAQSNICMSEIIQKSEHSAMLDHKIMVS